MFFKNSTVPSFSWEKENISFLSPGPLVLDKELELANPKLGSDIPESSG